MIQETVSHFRYPFSFRIREWEAWDQRNSWSFSISIYWKTGLTVAYLRATTHGKCCQLSVQCIIWIFHDTEGWDAAVKQVLRTRPHDGPHVVHMCFFLHVSHLHEDLFIIFQQGWKLSSEAQCDRKRKGSFSVHESGEGRDVCWEDGDLSLLSRFRQKGSETSGSVNKTDYMIQKVLCFRHVTPCDGDGFILFRCNCDTILFYVSRNDISATWLELPPDFDQMRCVDR